MKNVIFDLDGTLALIDNRRSISTKPNGKIDWDVFFDPKNINLDNQTFQLLKWLNFSNNKDLESLFLAVD